MDNGVARRGVVAGILLMALLWPAVGNAQEVPTDTTVPAEPPPTVPAVPDVPEDEPSSTTVPAPPVEPAAEPVIELDTTTAPAAEGGPRTLTVLPRRNLVDRQLVTIRGKGWNPHSSAQGFAQCISGTSDTSGCGRVEFVRNDAAGNFRARYRVDVILETNEGTFDCRVEVCVIGSNDTPVASGARFVRLHFDPAGPDPVRRTVTVDPTTDLVDGQEVTVTGDGFGTRRYDRYVEIFQCRLPAAGYDDCDPGTYEFDQADQDGHLDSKAHLEALLRFPDGTTLDCRTGGCALLVRRYDESFARGALVPLGYDPSAPLGPPPSVSIDPSADLVDGQIVDVTGADWRPNSYGYLAQCRSRATSYEQCSFDTLSFVDIEDSGGFETQVGVNAVFRQAGNGARVNCRVAACSLFVVLESQYENLTGAARARLRFDPDAPLLEPTIGTPDLTGLHAGDQVRIHGSAGRPEGTVVLIQCVANATHLGGCAAATRQSTHSHFEPRGRVGVSWETRFRFRRYLHLSDGRQVNCAHTPCALVAMDLGADLDRSDRIATGFVPG